jgi:hypothetical protein
MVRRAVVLLYVVMVKIVASFRHFDLKSQHARSSTRLNFERSGNQVTFGDSFSVNEQFANVNIEALAAFIGEPKQIVTASWAEDKIVNLGTPGQFRLTKEPLNFIGGLQLEFSVDVEVDTTTKGLAVLSSKKAQFFMSRNGREKQPVNVDIQVNGMLRSVPSATGTFLQGSMEYKVTGSLLGPLILLPSAVLRPATDAVNGGVIVFMRRDFVTGFKRNFSKWLTSERALGFVTLRK